MYEMKLTPKESDFIKSNTAIQLLIEKFGCEIIPSNNLIKSNQISARINDIFSERNINPNHSKIQKK